MKLLTINEITKEFAFSLSKEDIPKEKLKDYNVMQKCVRMIVNPEDLKESLDLFSSKYIQPKVDALVDVLKSENLILLYDIDWELIGENCSKVQLGLDDSIIDIRGIIHSVFIRFDVMCKENK